MVSGAAKREAVARLQAGFGMSERRACSVIGADRKSMRYRSSRPDDADLVAACASWRRNAAGSAIADCTSCSAVMGSRSTARRYSGCTRKSWLFASPDRGGERPSVMYTLIHTARLNDVDPQAWLADVLARIAEHPAHRLDELLPWNWHPATAAVSRAA